MTLSRSLRRLSESPLVLLSNGPSESTYVITYGEDSVQSDMSHAQPRAWHTVPAAFGCSCYSDFPLKVHSFQSEGLGRVKFSLVTS